MAYQLSDLITTIRKRAKDTSFDSDLITDYIQETQNEILQRSRFPFMQLDDSETVSLGSTDYVLDDEVDIILSLKLLDTAQNSTWEPQYMGYPQFFESFDPETATSGTPTFYTVYGNTVLFNVPLNKAYTLKVKYLKTPSVLSIDTDEPDIPERFKEVLIRGSLARIEEYRDNYDIAALHERKVEALTEDMLSRLSLRQMAQPHKARFGVR